MMFPVRSLPRDQESNTACASWVSKRPCTTLRTILHIYRVERQSRCVGTSWTGSLRHLGTRSRKSKARLYYGGLLDRERGVRLFGMVTKKGTACSGLLVFPQPSGSALRLFRLLFLAQPGIALRQQFKDLRIIRLRLGKQIQMSQRLNKIPVRNLRSRQPELRFQVLRLQQKRSLELVFGCLQIFQTPVHLARQEPSPNPCGSKFQTGFQRPAGTS